MCDGTTLKYLSEISEICQKDTSLYPQAEEGIKKIINSIQPDQQLIDDNESYKSLKLYEKIQKYLNENKKSFPKIKDFKLFVELIKKSHRTQAEAMNKPSTSFRKHEMFVFLDRIYEHDPSIFEQIKQFIDDHQQLC